MLPVLAGVAQEVLGNPRSSATTERVFSVEGRNVTRIRNKMIDAEGNLKQQYH